MDIPSSREDGISSGRMRQHRGRINTIVQSAASVRAGQLFQHFSIVVIDIKNRELWQGPRDAEFQPSRESKVVISF